MPLSPVSKNLPEKLGVEPHNFVVAINQPDNYFGLLSDLPHGVRFLQIEDNIMVDSIHLFVLSQQELIHELFASKPLLKNEGNLWIFYPKKASRIKTDLDVNIIIGFGHDIHLNNIQLIDFDEVWTGIEFKIQNHE